MSQPTSARSVDAVLTLPQYRVLVFLSVRDRPAAHVAALLGVTPPTVTSVVDGLASRGLVARAVDPEDRRRVRLSITPAGVAALTAGDEVVGAGLVRLLGRLDETEAETALVGLELLNHAMELALEERFGDDTMSSTK